MCPNVFSLYIVILSISLVHSTGASDWAPATPQQQESAGVNGEDEQVKAKQQLVYFVTKSEPVFLSQAVVVFHLEGKFEGNELL